MVPNPSYPRKLLTLLTPRERRRGCLLLGMIIVMALLDVVGVASTMPFISVLAKPETVDSNPYLAAAYDHLGVESTERFLLFLGVVVFVALVTSIAFRAITTYALLHFTQMRRYSLATRIVTGYLRQPYDWFLNRHSADLGKTVLSETDQVVSGSLVPFMQCLAHGAVAVALLTLLIAVDAALALTLAAVIGGVYCVIYLRLRGYLGRIGEDRVQANRERFEAIHEAFGGVKEIKVAGLEGATLDRFYVPARRYAGREAAALLAAQLPRFVLEILTFGGLLATILYLMAGDGDLHEALPVLSVYAFAGYRLVPALQMVYAQYSRMRFTEPALDALHREVDNLEIADTLRRRPPAALGIRSGLRLEQVVYTYPKAAQPALNGLTLEVPAGATIGLVGPTGCGKTTTVDIVLGLLRPQTGQLFVDGEPITSDNVRAWQRSIGYVPQHIYLTDNTVAGNIAFGIERDRVDPVAVEQAARIANLHDFVVNETPSGYETTVGERGVRLSGGQRQRIGIARALYHDPDVLIMDEATSALDNLTEQAVMEAVHRLGSHKTIVLIAHRLTTIRDCDDIFVLDKGRLVGQGRYDDLLANNACFAEIAQAATN